MTSPPAQLDHLTVLALSLEAGAAHVRRALGVEMPYGGAHPLMGTHNCLMRLGDGVFLEVLAPDPSVTPQRKRWFGLDDPDMRASLQESPRLVSWVVRVPNIGQTLRGNRREELVAVTRDELSWLIGIARDGSMPFGGAYPTMIEWPAGPHPSSRMADLGCRVECLFIEHPEGRRLAQELEVVIADERVVVSIGGGVRLRARIVTPTGTHELC